MCRYAWHTRNHISLAVWVTLSGEPFVEFLEKQTSEENEECGINARHPAPVFNILIKKRSISKKIGTGCWEAVFRILHGVHR